MITLDEFKNNVIQLAKPNRFTAEIVYDETVYDNPDVDPFSDIIDGGTTAFLDELRYLVQDASIPNRTQTNITVKYHGMKLELPGDFDHTDLTIKFINKANWLAREFFFTWMEMIQSTSTWTFFSKGVNKRLDSTLLFKIFPKIIVRQIGNTDDEILASYVFYNAYPKELSEIKLSMADDNIETFDVTFAYSYYERDFNQTHYTYPENTTNINNRIGSGNINKVGSGKTVNALAGKQKEMTQQEKNQRAIIERYNKIQNENPLGAKTGSL